MLFWPILILAVAILTLVFAYEPDVIYIDDGPLDMRFVYLLVLGAGLSAASAGRMLLKGGQRAKVQSAIWLGAIAGLSLAFVLRNEAAELLAPKPPPPDQSVAISRVEGQALVPRDEDGHFTASAWINGVEQTMLVDTGASMVLIPYESAYDLGIDASKLDYSIRVTTANGGSRVAPVQLSSVRIQSMVIFDVPAAVAQPGRLKTGLLGISFLNQLSEVSFRPEGLVLRGQGRFDAEAMVPRDQNGRFSTIAFIDDVRQAMLVDTNSATVMIPYEAAHHIGIDPANLDFSARLTTASGEYPVAPVRLASVRIQSLVVLDVPAVVMPRGRLNTGVLGTSFLNRLAEVSFRPDGLILRGYAPARAAYVDQGWFSQSSGPYPAGSSGLK